MKSLYFVGLGVVMLALTAGCHADSATSALPVPNAAAHRGSSGCSPTLTLTVCVRIVQPGSQVTITDTIGGDTDAVVAKATCPPSGSIYVCVVNFSPPENTLNQVEIDSSGTIAASGAFPVYLAKPNGRKSSAPHLAVLEGSSPIAISKIGVVPFQVSRLGESSRLALGQTQHVWIVASDAQHEVIVGPYQRPLSITASSALVPSGTTLNTTADAEALTVGWNEPLTGTSGSGTGTLEAAEAGSGVAGKANLRATSGVIYHPVGPNNVSAGPGPVAVSADGNTVYFAVNDESYGGCRKAPCKTELGRFSLVGSGSVDYVPLKSVPGVSQLYISSNGALWISTFQPVGTWAHDLPALRMPKKRFSEGSLQTLKTGQFGEPSGFVEDDAKNLWISSCTGTYCKQNQNGTPVLIESSSDALKADRIIALKRSCLDSGYLGFSVGDVALYYGGDLYVLGINDGSAPPARGNIWRVSPQTYKQSCVDEVPSNFNPSPYFSTITDASGAQALAVGAGGNNANFRWQPDHGFYLLRESGSNNTVTWDNGPAVTANHVSAYKSASGIPGSVLYYASSGKLDLRFPGLGTYQPSANPPSTPSVWAIFPSASFSGNQSDNGVAAAVHGAWYAASGTCGDAWKGVCLAHAVYLPQKYWGLLPRLMLAPIEKNDSAAVGVITDPQGIGSGVSPLNAHSGPFFTKDESPKVCTSGYVKGGTKGGHAELIFGINALGAGICRIQVYTKSNAQDVVTSVTLP